MRRPGEKNRHIWLYAEDTFAHARTRPSATIGHLVYNIFGHLRTKGRVSKMGKHLPTSFMSLWMLFYVIDHALLGSGLTCVTFPLTVNSSDGTFVCIQDTLTSCARD